MADEKHVPQDDNLTVDPDHIAGEMADGEATVTAETEKAPSLK
ncbi:hypothetical protein [Hymenobacter qilianensis]|nr:hypothetical protein [Hymenobacter qilianensis]